MRSIDETFETFGKRVLWLGYAGEEDRSTLIVDLHDILLEFPGATAVLKVRPPDEKAAYPAITETIDDKLHWSISDSDTAKEGRGELQLSLISPTGSKIKTAVAAMEISRSLPDGGQKPDRIDDWMEKAEVARKKAEDAATKADIATTKANEATSKANTAASNADTAASKAEAKANLANDAATKADTATSNADAATSKANTAASNADAKAKLANDAAKRAEDAAEKADKARQNILIGTETGNPASVSDAFSAPLCGLTVYGKSTQDGTPSPDNPVPIESAGDGGSVAVKVTGKNLFPVITKANLTEVNKPTGGVRHVYIFHVPAGSSVTVSGNDTIDTNCYVGDFDIKTQTYTQKALIASETGEKKSTVLQRGWYVVYLATEYIPHIIKKLNEAKIQIEIGTESTAYSPYCEQLLTLPTPNGLPGIPVTSGGNYTDQNGQQWVCDEVDLERGVKVQRVDKAAFDSTKTLVEQNAILATPVEIPLTPAELTAYKALATYAPNTVVQASDGAGLKLDYQRDVNIVIKNLEDAIASMTTT